MVSMVFDYWNKKHPWLEQPDIVISPNVGPSPSPLIFNPPSTGLTEDDVKRIIKEFFESIESAKIVDRLTEQPDCEDPEKAKLEAKVKRLEKQLAKLKGKR